jgi:diamine N-acetyltransferase
MSVEIKKATEKDTGVIHQLASSIWRKHYPGIISNEQIDYMLEKMYSTDSLLQQLKDGHHFYLATEKQEPIGYYSYSETIPGKYFLHKLYILTDIQRKGTGKLLLNHLISLIPDTSELRLTVNRKNFKAINFYFKNGFIIESVKDFDIGNGYLMEDFVMLRK